MLRPQDWPLPPQGSPLTLVAFAPPGATADSTSLLARLTPHSNVEFVAVVTLAFTALAAAAAVVQLVVSLAQESGSRGERGGRRSRLRNSLDAAVERGAGVTLGTAAYWFVTLALLAFPAALTLGFAGGGLRLFTWFVFFVAKVIYDQYERGAYVERARRRLSDVNLKLASTLDTLGAKLHQSHNQRLSEEASRALVHFVLQRVHEYAAIALDRRNVRLRATLAVPDAGRQNIRVWCYNDQYDDRRYTNMPLLTDGRPGVGAPAAFITRKHQIIPDIHQEDVPGAKERRFRSVLSIPVMVGGPGGTCVAVLNIDGEMPNLFSEDRVEEVFIPLLASPVNILALVLLMRRNDAAYAFGH